MIEFLKILHYFDAKIRIISPLKNDLTFKQ